MGQGLTIMTRIMENRGASRRSPGCRLVDVLSTVAGRTELLVSCKIKHGDAAALHSVHFRAVEGKSVTEEARGARMTHNANQGSHARTRVRGRDGVRG